MVQVIYGKRGSGKTKRMIDMANTALGSAKGSIIFVDDDHRCILELDNGIRYINAKEFDVDNAQILYGFICGLLAGDFDVEQLYLDGFPALAGVDSPNDMADFYMRIKKLAKEKQVQMILGVSGAPDDVPAFLCGDIIA